MKTTMSKDFLFKGSQYDFDHILYKNGYELKFDREDVVMFTKIIKIDNEYLNKHSEKFKMVIPFSIDIQRPKMLNENGKYDVCSPYFIVCNYYTNPLYSSRQISWSVFPGINEQILDKMLDVIENEAKDIYKTFMSSDLKIN